MRYCVDVIFSMRIKLRMSALYTVENGEREVNCGNCDNGEERRVNDSIPSHGLTIPTDNNGNICNNTPQHREEHHMSNLNGELELLLLPNLFSFLLGELNPE
jgi:hypothetical protein